LFCIAPVSGQTDRAAQCGHSTIAEFSAGLEPKAKAFLATLKAALRTAAKSKIAALVQYPLNVNTEKGHRLVRTGSQFITEYEQLFTASVRKAIEKQTPECLFANWQGVMIGDGEVWFEEQRDGSMKIKTLNIP
jgi:hypothetical protein